MNVIAIIKELRQELERIDTLILALETLQAGKRRGRPPKALQDLRAGNLVTSSPSARRAARLAVSADRVEKTKKRLKKASSNKRK